MTIERWWNNGRGILSNRTGERRTDEITEIPPGYVPSADRNPRHFVEILPDGWENHIEITG